MSNRLTVKQILSRVRNQFPDIQETYGMALINDALTELGKYNVKYESAKTDSVSGKAWYTINDANSGIEVNKIFKVSFMDNGGDYKRIPRLLANDTDIEDLILEDKDISSTYTEPADYLIWIIRGDNLGIFTSKYNVSTNTDNDYVAIDESVTNGILINFTAEPDTVTAITDYPDVDNTIHLSIVDYLKARLYLDKAGKEEDPNKALVAERLSQMHERRWNDSVKRFGSAKRSKIGGVKEILVQDFR